MDKLIAEGDRLLVPERPELLEFVGRLPDFWFLVGDGRGGRSEHAPVPEGARDFFTDPCALVEVEICRDAEHVIGSVIGTRRDSAVGQVTILTAGGPTLGPLIGRLKGVTPYCLLVLAIATMVLALAIPWLMRRDLAGVAQVAAEAAHIDIDRPETRLTEANMPPAFQMMVRAMNAALARLGEGIERRRRFRATAAHELRTPVAVLGMRVELLPAGPERPQLMLDVTRLLALADQFLDLEGLEQDTRRSAWLDLRQVVREALAEIAPLAVASRVDLPFQASDRAAGVVADCPAIHRVVGKLKHNAIAHGGGGKSLLVEVRAPDWRWRMR